MSIEVVEAVVEALAGKLSANAVNAPMMAPEVLRELQPFVQLAEGLGKVRGSGREGEGRTVFVRVEGSGGGRVRADWAPSPCSPAARACGGPLPWRSSLLFPSGSLTPLPSYLYSI